MEVEVAVGCLYRGILIYLKTLLCLCLCCVCICVCATVILGHGWAGELNS